MGKDIPLGRLFGIRVSMSWTVPAIGLLYAVTLANNRFPIEVPGLTTTTYWSVGILGAVLFFISLLAHEAGHALVARHEGIGVEGISLTLLGGVTKMEHESRTAGSELRISAVGPVVTAAVGVLFWFFSQALSGSTGTLDVLAHLFGWLAFVNLLLAAFNMLPGAPLDGGRVMSALVWMRTKNQTTAHALGARIGQALGALMVIGGIYLMRNTGNPNGIWVLIVGAYIFSSASSERKLSASLGVLRDVRMSDVMDPDPPVLPEWMSVQDLVTNAQAYLPHTAFVAQGFDGRVTGLITAEAVQATDPRTWPMLHLSDLAFPVDVVLTASVNDSVLVTMQRARATPTRRVLVLWPDGRVAGVTGDDIARRASAVHSVRSHFALSDEQPMPPAPLWTQPRSPTVPAEPPSSYTRYPADS